MIIVMLTLDNSQQNNDDKEKECNIEQDSINFIWVSIRGVYFITYNANNKLRTHN